MKAFLKALRYCKPYWARIALGWLCALVATSLYMGSLGAVAPLFSLMFEDSSRGVHYTYGPLPDNHDVKAWTLDVSPHYTVEPDPAVETFVVSGDTVRVNPSIHVVRSKTGLLVYAQQAQDKGKFYAPALMWVARAMPADRYDCLLVVMVGVVIMTILRGTMQYTNEYLVGHATNRAMLAIRLRVYDHVLRSPLTLYTRVGATDIISRFQQDCFLVQEGLKTLIGKVFSEPIRAVGCLSVAVYFGLLIDPWLPPIVLVGVPITAYLVRRLAKIIRRSSRKALESWASLMNILEESLFGIRVVKGYGLEGHERRAFFQAGRRLFNQLLRSIRVDAITDPAVETIFTMVAAVAVLVAGKRIIDLNLGPQGLTHLTLFFVFMVGALDPARKLSNVSNRFQQAAAGADRLFSLLETPREPRYGSTGKSLPRLGQGLELQGVSFAYTEGKPILTDINLSIRHGEVVAIIGRTGCGKTTLVSLIPRFFEPTSGAVLIDGTDVRDVTLRSLRGQIAYVPQETVLFTDTVAGNISLGAIQDRRHGITREEIQRAAVMAHADLFIRNMPQGYDSPIGEHGSGLSGGERQRLALARAIIRDPAILILDEATSALDEETQALVQDTLRKFTRGRTTILIAHRLSTLNIADRIVVMDAGRIIDAGTHEELLARCGHYRRLREVGLDGA
jgi:ABC-type multidrug transport system fused ATPase/permease subunit